VVPIKFDAKFADGVKTILLSAPGGAGLSWHVYIDQYYCGSFNKMLNGWQFYGNERGNALLTEVAQKRLLKMILKRITESES
jgi:hypothetical protein